jgi:hypothetical protein
MKIAKEKNRIALISGAASTPITNEDCNDVTVHWTYDTYAVANGTAKAVTKTGGKKWFFLTADYAFGHALEKDARPWSRPTAARCGLGAPPVPGLGLLVLPAQGPGLWRADHRPGQRRRRHHQLDQAGGRVRRHPQAVAGRPADVHHRRALAGPEDHAGHVPHRRLLLGPQRRDARLVQALLRSAQEACPPWCRPGSIRRSALPEGGQGGAQTTRPR